MTGIHRARSSRRAKRRGNGRLVIAAVAAALGTGAVAVGIFVLRPGDDTAGKGGAAAVQSELQAPRTGPQIKVTTPEGYGYSLAATGRGTTERVASGAGGTKLAYADYVLTNTKQDPVLLDFPADLFVQRSKAAPEGLQRCMPQPGADSDTCTLPNQSKIIGYLNGSKPPTTEGGDRFMPAGASYLVRLTTDLPVKDDTEGADIKLYIWNVRYIPDRKAVELTFP